MLDPNLVGRDEFWQRERLAFYEKIFRKSVVLPCLIFLA